MNTVPIMTKLFDWLTIFCLIFLIIFVVSATINLVEYLGWTGVILAFIACSLIAAVRFLLPISEQD